MRPAFVRPNTTGEGEASSELLPGEEFAVIEFSGHWAWGYCRADHYVGYVEAIALVEVHQPTHVVAAATAPIYAEADIHSPALAALPMGARVTGHESHGYLATDSGFIPFTHVRPVEAFEHDPVAVAERLIGAPYLHGGRTSHGIDCSGLVQIALGLCGIHAPRDSDQQRVLGHSLPDDAAPARGDLVFFEGHVGLMANETSLIHATAHASQVVVEPLASVSARTAILDRRRLP